MSTIIATTLSNGSVSVPTATVVNGSAKAWVNFNGTGTIAARDSLNLSSLTDNGTGDYTVNFSSALANTNYKTDVTGDAADTTASGTQRASLYSSTQYKVRYFSGGAAADTVQSSSSSHGDLA